MCGNIKEKVSVLVCSCDSYEDLWYPFFKLFKKYWTLQEVDIYLNTESKNFSFEGLTIKGIHPENKNALYGERMLYALSRIETEYVILFLDDFFLRKEVDSEHIMQIIQWMDEEKDIVCFNQDCLKTYADWEVDKYPGYRRLPWGTDYTLNMQVAVWRRDKFIKYWKKNVSPWEWEEYCNALTYSRTKDKFYGLTSYTNSFCDYGFNIKGMGVYHGKWVIDDVAPLFEKEKISVDFSVRGVYDSDKIANIQIDNDVDHNELVKKRLGYAFWIDYCWFCLKRRGLKKIRTTRKRMFYHYMDYLQENAKKMFMRRYPEAKIIGEN